MSLHAYHMYELPSVSGCAYLSLEQYADVVVGNGGAVQRGTLINLLHYHKMERRRNGRQGTAEVWSLGELDLRQSSVCVCVEGGGGM